MRTVSVTGHGEALVAPDTAVVRVAAVHRADGVADALAGADSAARHVAATAREFTAPELVGTSSLQIWNDHDQQGNPSGFRARHSLTVRCPDVATAGALLTSLAETVGDRLEIEGVSLELSDREPAETRAREAAYADAVARATHLAGLADETLGDPQALLESGYADVTPRAAKALRMSQSASVEPGEMSVSASVTVTFALV